MSIIVNFTPELSAWILHNLDRGCAVDDLVNSMVEQKFEPLIAHGLVEAFSRSRSEGIDPPMESVELDVSDTEYRYETPRIASDRVICTSDREIPVLLRLEQPILAVLDGLLSAEECEQLIKLACNRLQPSTKATH